MSEVIPLWASKPGTDPADVPTLTVYPPSPTGPGLAVSSAMVMICPGGGYQALAVHEGQVIAQWLNTHGFHAAVLRYRLAPRHRHPAMIHDAQRAMRILRQQAQQRRFKPQSIAVLGFSAGGHLASTLATRHAQFTSSDDDLAAAFDARPDAVVLGYPVIDMGQHAHMGSRNNLLGPQPDPALIALMSNQDHVSPATPPTFLWHTAEDGAVPVEGSLLFAAACRRHRVPVELHVYETGVHGLGLAVGLPAHAWADSCLAFLRRHLLKN